MADKKEQATEALYRIYLSKGVRYSYRGVIFVRGKVYEVAAKDRNYLVKRGFFSDYVEKPKNFIAVPEDDDAVDPVAELAAEIAAEEAEESEGAMMPRQGGVNIRTVEV